jgi:hypothetical protein
MTSQNPTDQHLIAGVFTDPSAAEAANQALQAAGFAAERVSTEIQALDPNPTIRESKAKQSGKAGALAGGLFGAMVCTLLSYGGTSFPGDTPVSFIEPGSTAWIVILIGTIAGAAGGGIIGGLSGNNVPNEAASVDRKSLSQKYLVKVEGTQTDLERAIEILRQQGSQV